jgi:hypothetical protein
MATEKRLDEVLALVLAQIEAKRRGLALRQVSHQLCTDLAIPPGRCLVPFLTGQPHMHDNQQAVCIWLGEQLADADTASIRRSAETLRAILILKLNSIERNL